MGLSIDRVFVYIVARINIRAFIEIGKKKSSPFFHDILIWETNNTGLDVIKSAITKSVLFFFLSLCSTLYPLTML